MLESGGALRVSQINHARSLLKNKDVVQGCDIRPDTQRVGPTSLKRHAETLLNMMLLLLDLSTPSGFSASTPVGSL